MTGIISNKQSEVRRIEGHGIDVIPEHERHSKPRELFFVFMGSQMCFGIIVIGGLPIIFGLSFWASVSAITLGVALGAAFFGPLAWLGARTGTNGPIASGAHLGIKSSSLSMLMTILIGLGFYALTVWTGGEALASGSAKLLGWESSNHLMALGAAIICAMTILAAIYGHNMIVASETLVGYIVAGCLLVTAIALAPQFDASYAGTGEYILGSFWPTWLMTTGVCAAVPISYSSFVNDYSRYLPANVSPKRVAWAAGGGMFIGCWIAFVFAAYVTSIFQSAGTPFVSGLMEVSPLLIVVLMILVGIGGSQPQGSLCLYNGGLGLQGLLPRLSRITTTLLLSLVGLVIVFTGIYLVNMVDMLVAFILLIECVVSPWLAINLVGCYYLMKGQYQPHDLFKSNTSAYWYSHGWNIKAMFAWIMGSIVGLLFTSTDLLSGPFADSLGGTLPGWLIAGIVGGALYFVAAKARPQAAARLNY